MMLRLRTRLLVGILLPLLVTGAIAGLGGAWLIRNGVEREALRHVGLQMRAARLLYDRASEDVAYRVRTAAQSPRLRELVAGGAPGEVATELERLRGQGALDFLDLDLASGASTVRGRAPSSAAPGRVGATLVRAVPPGRTWVVGTLVLSREELSAESPELAERARIAIVPTPHAEPSVEGELTDGLVIVAAVLLEGDAGGPGGVVYGGILINRHAELAHRMTTAVSQDGGEDEPAIGRGTICLGDVRVATDFRIRGGAPAIGTRVDRDVRRAALVGNRPVVARAFVVDGWNLTAYEPLRDLSGRTVGLLALGMPLQTFTRLKQQTIVILLGITLAGVVLAGGMAALIARTITRRTDRLVRAARHIAGGEIDHRVEPDPAVPELAELEAGFNRMAAAIQERDARIQKKAEEQIAKSERLGMIGRLAAGVAHEINNPLGGIMLFSNLLLRKAPAEGPERQNLERIASETRRCQKIVQGLLDFARPREPKVEEVSVEEVLDKTLGLLGSQGIFREVELVRRIVPSGRPVRGDAGQLQEVFLNLILNAVEAMKKKGKLTVSLGATDDGASLEASIADVGCGIPEADLERIFEPFFTTKDVGHGTGLGLSISRGIVESHGGTIWATSRVGEGSTFTVRLPFSPAKGEAA